MADIQEAQVKDAKGKRGRGNRQAYLLVEEDEGKVWFGLGVVFVEEARVCALEMAASL